MVSSTLHESFRTAYGFWRGVVPRGEKLFSFARELAKLPEFSDKGSNRNDNFPEMNPLVAAVLMLDEAWRRGYKPSEVTEDVSEELLSVVRPNDTIRLAYFNVPYPSLESRLANRHAELERVCLARPVAAFYEPEGKGFATNREVPAGATGTVVSVLGEGQGYEVEFTQPFAAIATVQDADLN